MATELEAPDRGEPAPRERKPSLLRTSLLLLPLQIVFRLGEAAMPLLQAAWFGRSRDTDFAILALAAFTLVGSLVFQSFQDSSLVPILLEAKARTPLGVPRLRGALWVYNALIGTALATVLLVGGLSVSFLVDGGVSFPLALRMLPLLCLQMILLGQKSFFLTMLHTERHFYATPVVSSIGVITNIAVMFSLKEHWGVAAIAAGLCAGEAMALTGAVVAVRVRYRIELEVNVERTEPLRRFLRLVTSEVGGSAITRVNPLADQFVAAFAGVVGGGTLLRYSNDVATVPTSLVQAALLPPLLAHLAQIRHAGLGTAESVRNFRSTVQRTVLVVFVVLTAAALLMHAVRYPLLELAFLRGEMDQNGVVRMAQVLPYHLVGLAPFGVLLVYGRAHVALQNSSIFVRLGLFNAVTNLILNGLLIGPLGLEGVALATSITHTAVAVVFAWLLRRKLAELHPGASRPELSPS